MSFHVRRRIHAVLCSVHWYRHVLELGPVTENVAATSGYALVLLGTALWMLLPIPGVWVGCAIALLASVFYFASEDRSENHSEKDKVSAL
jgi:hypothetical protein